MAETSATRSSEPVALSYAHEGLDGPIRRGPYPELTWPGIIVGWILGVLITVSMGYAALILGFSIEGSELAAILGWGILRGVMRRTSIVENNINQTVAAAVNGASAGMMFSIPALFILNRDYPETFAGIQIFNAPLMVLGCITGGVLGLSFVIPLRRQMIDFDRLAYPGGIAVAAILKSPGAGSRKAALMLGGGLIAAVFHFTMLQTLGDDPQASVGAMLRLPPYLNITFSLSLMTIGVGYLSGKGGFWFGAGGFLVYWFMSPLLSLWGSPEVKDMIQPAELTAIQHSLTAGAPVAHDAIESVWSKIPETLRKVLFQPVGIGMLIGAALGGIFAAFPLIRSAIQSMRTATQSGAAGGTGDKDDAGDEMPIRLLYAGVVGGVIALTLGTYFSLGEIPLWRAGLMATLGALWIWMAGVIVSECMGRTNWSPLSGMTLIAVTLLVMAAAGLDKRLIVSGSIFIGAAVCIAISQAGEMMMDLKAGYLVGARPKMQQIAQFIGMWLGPVLMIFLIFILDRSHGLGSKQLSAPQATALASTINSILGGDAPTYRYVAGAGLGAMLAFSGLGGIGVLIALGFYLPFNVALTYTIGCVLRVFLDKYKGRHFSENVGIPVAAGLIVGEALVGVGNALYFVIKAA